MVGRVAGVMTALAFVGALFLVSQPSEAAEGDCGPVTLDMLFPDVDADGQPLPGVTEPETSSTTTDPTNSTEPEATTTSPEPEPTTTTNPTSTPTTTVCRTWVYDMVWPLAGQGHVMSGFGADRDSGDRKHKGADIVAPKMAPVVAVADGTVTILHNTPAEDCCWVGITHADGWQSWYIHLNNDTYLTDDGLGLGVRADLVDGSEVKAGEVIGWVGDSGNAEGTVPHLHFELRNPSGYAVDPVPSLQSARSQASLARFSGPYIDDEGRPVELGLGLLASRGILWSCDPVGIQFCPDRLTSSDGIANLLKSMTGLEVPMVAERQQRLSFQNYLADRELSLVLGCAPIETCFQNGITAGDIARLSDWVLRSQTLVSTDLESTDLESSSVILTLDDARTAENSLRYLGIVRYCDPAINDQRLVKRADTVDSLLSWLWGVGWVPCYEPVEPTS